MHEYSLVQSMFDQIEALARERQALSVKRVCVKVGRAAGVDVSLFKTAYDTFRVHTICDTAPMDVDEVPECWSCPDGHGDIEPGHRLTCSICGRPARLSSGDEIILERVELEVP